MDEEKVLTEEQERLPSLKYLADKVALLTHLVKEAVNIHGELHAIRDFLEQHKAAIKYAASINRAKATDIADTLKNFDLRIKQLETYANTPRRGRSCDDCAYKVVLYGETMYTAEYVCALKCNGYEGDDGFVPRHIECPENETCSSFGLRLNDGEYR